MTDAASTRALLIVDVQPTFCEGGELPVPGGNAVAERIADFVRARHENYALIVTTQDWHIDPGAHFAEHPDFVDTWPAHGVAGTPGAELHTAIVSALGAIERVGDAGGVGDAAGVGGVVHVRKGAHQAAYSGFEGVDDDGRPLPELLDGAGVADVDVCGLAESHCVKSTALDAARFGYRTSVLRDLTAPVTEELGAAARHEMVAAGVVLVPADR